MSQNIALDHTKRDGTGSTFGGNVIIAAPIILLFACLAVKFGLLPVLFPGMRVVLVFTLLIALMLTGMPVSISLGLTVLTFLFTLTTVPLDSVALKLFTGIEKFEIMAIPFFILAGNFLTHGGVAKRMIEFAKSMVGHWYGGLGLAGVVACALFAAVSGSSPATVVAIGSIILPAMVKQGYPPRFGAGVITTSGALGILIPPSIVLVMYAVATSGMMVTGTDGQIVTSASIGQLFIAGIVPGMMLAAFLGATTFYRAWKGNYPRLEKASWTERFRTFRESFWGLLLIVIVIGGIYTGAFTPTEAAAMSAAYAFVTAVFVYKDMRLADVPRVLLASANMSAMLLYIITNAILFSFLMTHENIPQAMAAWISDSGVSWIVFLLFVNALLLGMGCIMEPSSIVLITAPILFPVAVKLGIDPVHFGILMVVNMEIGLCTPPVGLNLYVASGITKMGLTELSIAIWPWLLTMLVFLALVTYWPDLSLFLPRALGMM
jgi:C4-dicarboxylate transporter DctM subunit